MLARRIARQQRKHTRPAAIALAATLLALLLLALFLAVGPIAAAPRLILGERSCRKHDNQQCNDDTTQIDHGGFPEFFGACACRHHSSSMAPSIPMARPIPSTVSVTLAGSASLPFKRPPLTAARTACSISRCEVMPTFLRNLRTLTFNA